MAGKTILVVDDERNIVELVRLYLGNEGYVIETAYTGAEALRKVAMAQPALIVLDLMLPEVDGWEVCRRVRRDSQVPIIMLTARADDVDKIVGLEIGADDYIAKPFNPRELVARVKAVLRRAATDSDTSRKPFKPVLELGNTHIDPNAREVTIAGSAVEMRTQEFQLLMTLVENLGTVLERDRLLNMAWGYDYFGDTRTVDVHVAHLRNRLAGSCLSIQTVRGVGYKLVRTT